MMKMVEEILDYIIAKLISFRFSLKLESTRERNNY